MLRIGKVVKTTCDPICIFLHLVSEGETERRGEPGRERERTDGDRKKVQEDAYHMISLLLPNKRNATLPIIIFIWSRLISVLLRSASLFASIFSSLLHPPAQLAEVATSSFFVNDVGLLRRQTAFSERTASFSSQSRSGKALFKGCCFKTSDSDSMNDAFKFECENLCQITKSRISLNLIRDCNFQLTSTITFHPQIIIIHRR